MKLSIIDQAPVPDGFTPADALRNTIELAGLADRLGYERYWIAEHHAIAALASSAPEILIARVAAETGQIRVGSGGVMLPHYSALKVAESFRVLHALYPGRIDLGIGRAPGGTPLDTLALRRDRQQPMPDDFGQQLVELTAWLHGGFPADHPFSRIAVSPAMPGAPELWMLGSSPWSASAAAQLGLPYAFAHFIDQRSTRSAIGHYQSHFVAAQGGIARPYTILAASAIAAETDEEALRLLASARLFRRRIRMGDLRPIPTVEQAIRELGETPEPRPADDGEWPRYFAGAVETVRDQLIDLASVLNLDELMIVTIVHDHRARMRSYELLARAFDLRPRRIADGSGR